MLGNFRLFLMLCNFRVVVALSVTVVDLVSFFSSFSPSFVAKTKEIFYNKAMSVANRISALNSGNIETERAIVSDLNAPGRKTRRSLKLNAAQCHGRYWYGMFCLASIYRDVPYWYLLRHSIIQISSYTSSWGVSIWRGSGTGSVAIGLSVEIWIMNISK